MPELQIAAQYPTDETLQKLDRMAKQSTNEETRLLAETLAAISRTVIAIGEGLTAATRAGG